MSSFDEIFQYGYRLVSQHQPSTSPRSRRFPYLDGIPRPIPGAQIIKRRIKHTLLKRLRGSGYLQNGSMTGPNIGKVGVHQRQGRGTRGRCVPHLSQNEAGLSCWTHVELWQRSWKEG
jgi:hypothetical protein